MTSNVAQLASALHAISVLAIQQSPQELRVAVIGSHTFTPLSLVTSLIAHLPASCVVVANNANKVEQQALADARRYGYNFEEHAPAGEHDGDEATNEKNNALIQTTSVVVAFGDGNSQEISTSISSARKTGIPVFIITPPPARNAPIQNTLF
ncbi:hypothetical protein [Dictyobacter kobayashii]|uniref:DUF2493 domain-containing protein n=1 Tax=Dictyobacter kobayashii TaxID=2014872 RepID=A0A402AE56_9CHLR|nr:hypothetical protein [Dictyobacter kobayashii]GCE17332.1 hypothetical protein KDK_11320 [Dictyobacter kobayashii]